MEKDKSFAKAGALLVISGFGVKILSAVYRIPLTRQLGAVAMGRYSAVFTIFMPFFALSTAGIVPTLSRFAAQYKRDNGALSQLEQKAISLYLPLSVALTAFFLLFARFYAQRQGDSLLFTGSIILAPTIIFATAENIYKGVSQGRLDMVPTAISNLLESVCKTAFGLGGVFAVAHFCGTQNSDLQIKAALGAITLSGVICCVYLVFSSSAGNTSPPAEINTKGSAMLAMSVPVALSALVVSAVSFFDTVVCLPRISRIPYADIVKSFEGASFKNAEDIAMYLLGVYQGMVLTVFNLLPAITSAVASAALPVVTNAVRRGNPQLLTEKCTSIFRLTAAVSLPLSAYIYLFRNDIFALLFSTNSMQTLVPSGLLSILMLSSVFCCFVPVCNSVLYAAGRSKAVFAILITASAVRCGVNFVLCAVPMVNIRAFAVSAAVFYTIIFVLSMLQIRKSGVKAGLFAVFAKPIIITVISVVSVQLVTFYGLYALPTGLRLLFSTTVYGLVCLGVAFVTGIFVDIHP